MNTTFYTFLLACSVFLGGCCRTRQAEDLAREKEAPSQISEAVAQEKEPSRKIPEVVAREKEPSPMIQIQNLSIVLFELTLEYRLSNPFKDDIWICYDTSVYDKQQIQHAATRIDGETVRIQLRSNIERIPGFVNPYSVAKYICLKSGESCSGKIVRNLPAKDYVREWRESRKEHKEIDLHRVVFEVGYFGTKWNKFIDSWSEKIKKTSIESKPRMDGPYFYIPISPLIIEETMDGQLREMIYLEEIDPFRRNEESAEVVVTNVSIPCSVVVDDKSER